MALIIPIKDNQNHTLLIELESAMYKLGFKYNTRSLFWAMDVYDDADNLLLAGIKIVPNYPLIFSHKVAGLPAGDFLCEISDKQSRVVRDSFSSGKANLLYLTQDELQTF